MDQEIEDWVEEGIGDGRKEDINKAIREDLGITKRNYNNLYT